MNRTTPPENETVTFQKNKEGNVSLKGGGGTGEKLGEAALRGTLKELRFAKRGKITGKKGKW